MNSHIPISGSDYFVPFISIPIAIPTPVFIVGIYFRCSVADLSLPVLYSLFYSGAKHERHTGIAC